MLLLIPLCCDMSFIPDEIRWGIVGALILTLIYVSIWFGYELWKERKNAD